MCASRSILPIESLRICRLRQQGIVCVVVLFLLTGWPLADIRGIGPAHAQSVTLWPASPDPNAPPVFTCRTIHTYPHDPYAFTQGLVFEDGFFLEGTGLNGQSSLRKVIPETGRVVQRIPLPERYFGEGVTIYGNRLIQLTWKAHLGFVYDKQTFHQIRIFRWPHEGWGITENGRYLIVSDGSDRLFFLDPSTYDTHHVISVRDGDQPVRRLNELEFVEGYVLANIWQRHRIAVIAPGTGRVAAWIRLDQLAKEERRGVPNGIAYDRFRGRLFVTGKRWSQLFEVTLILAP